MKLIDAHTHISPEQQIAAGDLARQGLWQLVAATRPDQCQQVAAFAQSNERIIPTYGLHPWYAADFAPESMDEWLRETSIIGEIGLDTVWATTPLNLQRAAFLHQLQLAVQLQKTVTLHTKGAEQEILQTLQRHTPPQIIVHWYSGPVEYLADYIALGCYFTLGPDLKQNPAVRAVCRQVPLNRLLTETDGTGAVTWAVDEPCTMDDIPRILRGTLAEAAEIKGLTAEQMRDAVHENMMRVLGQAIMMIGE